MIKLNEYIDHTLLKATAVGADMETLCKQAAEYNFFAVCVNGCWVSLVKKILDQTAIKIAAVAGFPLGAMNSKAKIFETGQALTDGADEIDMPINIGWLKESRHSLLEQEIAAIKKEAGDKIVKIIIETCYLTETEKRTACRIVIAAGADYIKTSTGFGNGGADAADVLLIKEEIERAAVSDTVKIKASGGIKERDCALRYIEMGVSRLGTSSGIELLRQQ